MLIRIEPDSIEVELAKIKLDAPQFFRRCMERVYSRTKPHLRDQLNLTFKSIKKRSRNDREEERELIYELFLSSDNKVSELIYLYYITIALDPIQEFKQSQILGMTSIAHIVIKELSNV